MVPLDRPAIGEEKFQQLVCLRAFAESHQRADDADFVSAVICPRQFRILPAAKSFEVSRKGFLQRPLWQGIGKVELRDRIGGRGRIEIGPLDRSRNILQISRGDDAFNRADQIVQKRIGFIFPKHRIFIATNSRRKFRRRLQSTQGPEVVPIRMHRMRQVPFVARRFGQEPETRSQLAAAITLAHALPPQRDQMTGRTRHAIEIRSDKCRIAGRAKHFSHAPNELPMAVVLDQGIHAIAIDHTKHKAIVTLERGIPFHEVLEWIGQTTLRQSSAHDHAIADPRARVTPRTGLQGRAIAVDHDLRAGGAQCCDRAFCSIRHAPFDAAKRPLPLAHRIIARDIRPWCCVLKIGNAHRDLERRFARCKRPLDGGRCKAGFIIDARALRHSLFGQNRKHAPFIEACRTDARCRQRK